VLAAIACRQSIVLSGAFGREVGRDLIGCLRARLHRPLPSSLRPNPMQILFCCNDLDPIGAFAALIPSQLRKIAIFAIDRIDRNVA
jgi:hypothetical protein